MKTKLLTFLVVAWFSGVVSAQNYDFGDLPDSPYPTKLPNGARHIVSQSLFIGSTAPDFEADGNALASALGDDAAGIDDEDGVTPSALLITAGVRYNFRVKATNTLVGNAWLHAFADWNQDGDFADPNEYANVLVPGGSVDLFFKLPFDVPPTAITGAQTALRLRLSSDSVLLPTGAAQDGEVEDSLIPLHPPGELKDYGDLPDSGPGTTAGVFFTGTPPNYRTLLGDGGPSHGIKPEINFSNVG
ncbi:MAG: GEVED domain-containing protein, partial [Verrucomicrobia bacterium]|nr:GEVED domain-containing protein [Verrucomicrobiota bacterium]